MRLCDPVVFLSIHIILLKILPYTANFNSYSRKNDIELKKVKSENLFKKYDECSKQYILYIKIQKYIITRIFTVLQIERTDHVVDIPR